MPASDCSVVATYKAIPPTLYSLTVIGGSGSGDYLAGATVTIMADYAPDGQMFDCWTGQTAYVANTNAANTALSMPKAAITVKAT